MDTLIGYVEALFLVFFLLILARILLSWVMPSPPISGIGRGIYEFIHQTTDWYLNIFRRIIPPLGMIDLSPIVAIFVLLILENTIIIPLLQSF